MQNFESVKKKNPNAKKQQQETKKERKKICIHKPTKKKAIFKKEVNI